MTEAQIQKEVDADCDRQFDALMEFVHANDIDPAALIAAGAMLWEMENPGEQEQARSIFNLWLTGKCAH